MFIGSIVKCPADVDERRRSAGHSTLLNQSRGKNWLRILTTSQIVRANKAAYQVWTRQLLKAMVVCRAVALLSLCSIVTRTLVFLHHVRALELHSVLLDTAAHVAILQMGSASMIVTRHGS